jgi:hypothetical protein
MRAVSALLSVDFSFAFASSAHAQSTCAGVIPATITTPAHLVTAVNAAQSGSGAAGRAAADPDAGSADAAVAGTVHRPARCLGRPTPAVDALIAEPMPARIGSAQLSRRTLRRGVPLRRCEGLDPIGIKSGRRTTRAADCAVNEAMPLA